MLLGGAGALICLITLVLLLGIPVELLEESDLAKVFGETGPWRCLASVLGERDASIVLNVMLGETAGESDREALICLPVTAVESDSLTESTALRSLVLLLGETNEWICPLMPACALSCWRVPSCQATTCEFPLFSESGLLLPFTGKDALRFCA